MIVFAVKANLSFFLQRWIWIVIDWTVHIQTSWWLLRKIGIPPWMRAAFKDFALLTAPLWHTIAMSFSHQQTTFPQWQRSCCWPAWLCCWHRQASAGEKHSWPPCLCSSSVWVLHTGNGRSLMQTNSSSSSSQHLHQFAVTPRLCAYLLPVAMNSFLYSILRPSSKVTERVFTSTATAWRIHASVMHVKATLLSQSLCIFWINRCMLSN